MNTSQLQLPPPRDLESFQCREWIQAARGKSGSDAEPLDKTFTTVAIDWEGSMITLHVNGQAQTFDGDPSMPVLWYLRDVLGLTGTKFGCGVAACGACTIHLDGDATRSCQTQMADANGKSVVTIEGLDPEGNHPVQKAWREVNVPQCGYCQAGQIMQAVALLKQTPHPTDSDIDTTMYGNICRCGTYQRIRAAIKQAAGA
jgi:isoquinoline 1-oxidoreductase alpha subunit